MPACLHSTARKASLAWEEANTQSISLVGMPVYSRYATFGKKKDTNKYHLKQKKFS